MPMHKIKISLAKSEVAHGSNCYISVFAWSSYKALKTTALDVFGPMTEESRQPEQGESLRHCVNVMNHLIVKWWEYQVIIMKMCHIETWPNLAL